MSHTDERPASDTFAALAAEPYVSLTTFRRDGTAVPTTVWAAPFGGRLLVWTGAESGKVKRLRNAPVATVAPCDQGGSLLGDPAPAHVRIMRRDEKRTLDAALKAKYGWQFRISALGAAIGRLIGVGRRGQIGLEITLDQA
ncbi:PPOX class F420-dependent oxidoreductase [Cryptosporangium arvum]|uniref:PPOX class putative F420-dependent enzyme n=1 Tax=Cryptosporangium arvum DSM 44712 TaxID=927661 RepID=A0A010YKT7_9ACTN|nr:PPOX class F420-dependent oxidoreductase [Cryptosporangium arvum]EXG80835.1 PPOX class putative F420-dependent enzyme [Cryptosporangium arvum DSM 44712]